MAGSLEYCYIFKVHMTNHQNFMLFLIFRTTSSNFKIQYLRQIPEMYTYLMKMKNIHQRLEWFEYWYTYQVILIQYVQKHLSFANGWKNWPAASAVFPTVVVLHDFQEWNIFQSSVTHCHHRSTQDSSAQAASSCHQNECSPSQDEQGSESKGWIEGHGAPND